MVCAMWYFRQLTDTPVGSAWVVVAADIIGRSGTIYQPVACLKEGVAVLPPPSENMIAMAAASSSLIIEILDVRLICFYLIFC